MSPDLKSLMNRSAPEPSGRVDIDAVDRRSRGLRRRDRLITLTSTLALGLAVFLFFAFAQPRDESSEQKNERSQVVNPGPEEESSETSLDDRAATFAISAVADAGLHDPTGIYFDYIDLDKTSPQGDAEDKWIATFSGPECKNFNTRKCIVMDGTAPNLKIESDGNDFTVTGVEGALSEWSEQLVGITHPTDFGPPRYVYDFYDVSNQILGPVGNDYLIAAAYWTGPIPGMFSSNCALLTGQAGDLGIRVLEEFEDYGPSSEGDRDKVVEFGSQERIDLDPATALVNCSRWENLNPPPYEMPPVPEGLELVEVGPEVIVPEETLRAPNMPAKYAPDSPTGSRYVVAHGIFDQGDWGEDQGKEWWYILWGNEKKDCEEFEIGDLESDGVSWGCSIETPNSGNQPGVIGHTAIHQGTDPVLSLAYGQVGPGVAIVDFELTTDELVRVEALEPPDELKTETSVNARYYVAFLPPAANGVMVARDANGEELGRDQICSVLGCEGLPE